MYTSESKQNKISILKLIAHADASQRTGHTHFFLRFRNGTAPNHLHIVLSANRLGINRPCPGPDVGLRRRRCDEGLPEFASRTSVPPCNFFKIAGIVAHRSERLWWDYFNVTCIVNRGVPQDIQKVIIWDEQLTACDMRIKLRVTTKIGRSRLKGHDQ